MFGTIADGRVATFLARCLLEQAVEVSIKPIVSRRIEPPKR